MSDLNTPAPEAVSSTPVADSSAPADSTASIVQETLGSLDEGTEGTETSTPDPVASTSATPAEIDELAQAFGIVDQGTAKWKSRVPYSKINKIWKEQQAKLQTAHEEAIKGHTDKLTAFEQERQDFAAVEQMILSNDPGKFVESLVQLNPAFQQYLTGGQRPAVDPHAQAVNADGTVNLQALTAQIEKQVEQRIAQRYAPIEQEHKSRAMYAAALPKVQAQLSEAEKWPMFTEHKTDILKALQADSKLGLTEAYQKVVIPKLAANRDTMRKEVLAEIKGRPHSTAAISSAASSVRDDAGPVDTNDIVRRTLSRLT